MVRELIDRWDGSGCVEVLKNGTSLESDCCPGGTIQGNDLQLSGGLAIPWLLILIWIFLGVMIGADVFMSAIDVITSAEVTKQVTTRSGKVKTFHVRRWNETVANLTLMALGSSAPEILLNVMEIFLNNFHAGALGPSTIVGSAAFNLFVITAVCVAAIPEGESRTIKSLGVFLVTSFFSIIAYLWLLVMVRVSTPEIITIPEALITCGLMVSLLLIAYRVDKYTNRLQYKINIQGSIFRANTVGNMMKDVKDNPKNLEIWDAAHDAGLLPVNGKEFDPEKLADQLRDLAPARGKAFYRHQLLESVPGAGNAFVVNQHSVRTAGASTSSADKELSSITVQNGTASSTKPGHAGNAAQKQATSADALGQSKIQPKPSVLPAPPAGVIRFVKEGVRVMESDGSATVHVERSGGMEGTVTVQYTTKDQQARCGKDYEASSGSITFKPGEFGPKPIKISIIDDDDFEKDETFTVVLSEPTGGAVFDQETDGGASSAICTVTIANDDERATRFAKAMAILKVDMDELDLVEASWEGQIRDAFTCPSRNPWTVFVTLLAAPWKIMFALVPPPQLFGGFPCFLVALALIGFQVMLISDFANQMGCMMGLTPAVTAITFVALGTSLPDLFASKQAAIQDRYADNSVGNVTGSNSVNVFGGLGLPWLIASIYWSNAGQSEEWKNTYPDLVGKYPRGGFVVRAGDLTFSVIIFSSFAAITVGTILFRRPFELGGNVVGKYATASIFICMWILYVLLSALVSVGTLSVNI